MEYITLKEICSIKTGKLDANSADDNGIYPFFTCAKEPSRINTFAYDCNCVLLAGNGEFNVNMYNGKFNAYQRTYIIEIVNKQKYNLKLVYYLVKNSIEHFKNISNGGVIKFIKLGDVQNIKFPQVDIIQQNQIVTVLDTINSIIDDDKKQLELLDELIKSRFIEMFGDPVSNSMNLPLKRFDTICENLDSRRKPITASERTEGIFPYYGASGIVDYVDGFIFDEDILLISEDGANLLARSTPIAFSSSGKVWVNNHAHVVKFKEFATQKYVEYYFSMIDVSEHITGSAQPKFNQAKLNSMMIPMPELEKQKEYLAFIEQIDKSKFNKY